MIDGPVIHDPVDHDDPPPTHRRSSLFGDAQLADVAVAGAALFLLIANAPGGYRGSPVLLAVVALPLGAAGLASLVVLARRGDVAARWAVAFAAWAGLATLLAHQPGRAFDGTWSGDRGFVYFAAYLGCWAIGRRRGHEAARLTQGALLVGLALNVLIAFAQAATPNGTGLVSLYEGRVMGFPMNPVFLGALMAGGVAMVSALTGAAGRRWVIGLVPIFFFALVTNMSGSRVSFAAVVLLGPLAAWWVGRQPRRLAAVAAAIVGGFLVGSQLLGLSATSRLDGQTTGSGLQARSIMWEAGARAVAERPITGWGPNRFRAATSPKVTAEFVRNTGGEGTYADAHNVVVEVGVATGVVGLGLAGGFAWSAARRARGPLAWYAAGVSVSFLMQPFSVATVATTMLALGLAAPFGRDGAPDPAPAAARARWGLRVGAAVLALAALASAGRVLYADRLLGDLATVTDTRQQASDAAELVPGDPFVRFLVVQLTVQDATLEPELGLAPQAIAEARQMVDDDPAYYLGWLALGAANQRLGEGELQDRHRAARPYYVEALAQHPWSVRVLRALHRTDLVLARYDDAARWEQRLCEIDACPES